MKNNNVIEVIKQGGVVIMPTDTIYGIVGDATNELVIKKVFDLKKREGSKAMLILVSDVDMLNEYVECIGDDAKKLISSFWPGPLTIIFKKRNVSDLLTGGIDTVGIRCPKDDRLLTIIKSLGKPILSTSVNVSGTLQATSIDLVDESILSNVDLIIDEGICEGVASTIVGLDNKILREGEIKEKDIFDVLNN
jgi:L-threonylcarbamoyladenylate synthase